MTVEPFVVDSTAPLAECRQLMRECHIRHLPVVDNGRLTGLLHATTAFGRHSNGAAAGDLCTKVHVQAHPDEAVYDVLGRCSASLEDACVVVDRQQRVVGIFTDRDVVAMAAQLLPASVLVESVASTTLRTVSPSMRVSEALDEMRSAMARHLVVTSGQTLLGVVSMVDLLIALDPRAPLSGVLGVAQPVVTAWGASLRSVAETMGEMGVDAVALSSREDRSEADGLVTITDLLRALRLTPNLARPAVS